MLPETKKDGFCRHILMKASDMKFHANPSSGSNADNADRQTDITKLTGAVARLCECT